MRKWICVVFTTVWVCLALASCNAKVEQVGATASMFVEVERANSWRVLCHRDTRVMYAVSDGSYNYGTFTLLVDADGNPMLYEEAE